MFKKKTKMVKDKINRKDLGIVEDAMFTIRNLTAWEDHLSAHIKKLKDGEQKDKFVNILNRVRERRSLIMDLIVKENPVYAEWCMTKHGCSSSMGCIELGNRFLTLGDKKKMFRCFEEALECQNDVLEINDIPKEQKEAISEA